MSFTVEVTQEFEKWWHSLSEDERISVDGMIRVLEAEGPAADLPYSTPLHQSTYPQLRQLRVPHGERVICVIYVSDTARNAAVLLTGSTAGSEEQVCPPDEIALADAIYQTYLSAKPQH